MKPKELILCYVLTFIAFMLTIFTYALLPPQIPLWYSLSIPEKQLVSKNLIVLFPAVILLIAVSHALIINILRSMDAVIIRVFASGTTLVIFLFLIALFQKIYIFL